jgi:hypothetical protein
MKRTIACVVVSGLAAGVVTLAAPKRAAADDDCLELGWKSDSGDWTYHRAWVDSYDERGRVHIKYDYHHGELEMRVHEREDGDGDDVLVMKGKWKEGRHDREWGRVRLQMEKGHHHARGWYTYGDDETTKFDMVLRDCDSGGEHHHHHDR